MRAQIAVVGLGFIGLPLALALCERGERVVGVDVDERKVRELRAGVTHVMEPYRGESLESILRRHLSSGRFYVTTSLAEAAAQVDTFIVTVGLPVAGDAVDKAPLLACMRDLGALLSPGQLVLIRSTLVPGMMERDIIPRLASASGLVPGRDFHVAYAPERVAEGRAMEEFQTLDVIVAGLTEACTHRAMEVLARLTDGQLHPTSLRVAELSKVVENAQRDVNIALAHELKAVAEQHEVDVYELIRMANTHPRVRLLEPNIGVGGFCIPNAYAYLAASIPSEEHIPLFSLARQINLTAPHRAARQLDEALRRVGKPLVGARVAVLGLGMKDGSNDIRQSPAVHFVDILAERGAIVAAFDPTVEPYFPFQAPSLAACVADADAVAVATWQTAFDDVAWPDVLALARSPLVILDLKRRIAPRLAAAGWDVPAKDHLPYVAVSPRSAWSPHDATVEMAK
ncbi:nucleotide sugar dehydrogenase [Alicyclobacillus vulcanalis]|uniref:UDP-N-acetyl-D-mannosaminuronic acid dehydrogenase n=1 Tax=Alicyclobacillus vulcanalis TaxID=252246 RepID=A0A1N7MAY8_9BACL|nr:nucleotide sugar dehydrogenase [Alicyclobacillus vulcanalis]SIS83248.1 UDP-N-acetyl-D-mannosaminuronic acid dehydrogenase [Alicyclobacillus vulcanalis]